MITKRYSILGKTAYLDFGDWEQSACTKSVNTYHSRFMLDVCVSRRPKRLGHETQGNDGPLLLYCLIFPLLLLMITAAVAE